MPALQVWAVFSQIPSKDTQKDLIIIFDCLLNSGADKSIHTVENLQTAVFCTRIEKGVAFAIYRLAKAGTAKQIVFKTEHLNTLMRDSINGHFPTVDLFFDMPDFVISTTGGFRKISIRSVVPVFPNI